MKIRTLGLLLLGLLSGLGAYGYAQAPTDCVLNVVGSPGGSYVATPSSCVNPAQKVTVSGTAITVNNNIRALVVNFGISITGSPAAMSIPIQGCLAGGACDSVAATYTSTSTGNQAVTFSNVYDYFKLVPTFSGGTAPTVTVTTTETLAQGSGGSLSYPGVPPSCFGSQLITDSTTGDLYSCNSGVPLLVGPGAAGSAAWNTVTSGTNAGQTLHVGNGSTLDATGTGAINATSAAKWATARSLAGNSVDGSANVAFSNKFVVQGTVDAGLSGAQFLGALSTGILKNTTTTGVLSIAVAGDFPTLNQDTTGSAAKWATARSLAGNSVDGSANVPFANAFIVQGTSDAGLSGAQFLGALATGLLKNTTTTGVLSAATATDVTALFSCGSKGYLYGGSGGTGCDAGGGGGSPGGSSGDLQDNDGSGGFGAAHLNDNGTTITATESITPAVAAAKNLGTAPLPFGDLFLGNAANQSFDFTVSALTTNRHVAVQDAASTITTTAQEAQIPSSAPTGILRGASPFTGAELSGDATTSGSNAVSVVKVNGNTPGGTCTNQFTRSIDSSGRPTCATVALTDIAAQAADTVVINATGGSAAPTAVSMPICTSGADLYNTSTHTWSCVAAPVRIASGTATINPGAVTNNTCTSAIDGGTATGVLTTDRIEYTPNADPTGYTGWGVSATGALLNLYAYPTADHVNFKVCNSTSGPITPSSMVVNWAVLR